MSMSGVQINPEIKALEKGFIIDKLYSYIMMKIEKGEIIVEKVCDKYPFALQSKNAKADAYVLTLFGTVRPVRVSCP